MKMSREERFIQWTKIVLMICGLVLFGVYLLK